ncbi:MAG: thiamine phosphate synthase [Bacteroides sp.]|nr:thiamine phosphate synthase [Bacteroides sp.]
MLQYITNTDCATPVADQIFAVIDGGCRWVQIRMKDASDDEIRKVVEAVMPKCIEKEVFLLLDDRVELAKELNVGGVHLGKDDMPCSKARMILGPAAVIGVTANTFADVVAVSNLDIDYYGIGPFATTTTKKHLAPVLGIEGIRQICTDMNEKEINIPKVAVGGIKYEDVLPLIEAGVNGVAVSGAIAFAKDLVKETERFVASMPNYEGNS